MSERSINDLPEGYEPAVALKENYKPLKKEEYMCEQQIEYFRRKLVQWQEELVKESQETINNLQGEVRDIGDEAERASRETENTLELRTRDRYRKLLSKIRKALIRIQDGDYGYCEDTDEEIGLNRLIARPIATLTIDAQERWELRQRLLKEGR
ncbi:DksA family protein PA5536 (no Zn-finger) [hydrothermal vent metagenome]|uniref:DksA family protein PA5536 (No Zn-finger) n=1 Tax=hydrothermal vent metagenome TaxID=652676 RepID=A0A3B0VJS0_9ZZZZ